MPNQNLQAIIQAIRQGQQTQANETNQPPVAPQAGKEADMGMMGGYDPNLGLGQAGYAQATAQPSFDPRSISPQFGNPQNSNSTLPLQNQMAALQRNIK